MRNKTEPSVWGPLFPPDIRYIPQHEIATASDVGNECLRTLADEWSYEVLGNWPRLALSWKCGVIRGH